MSFETQLETRRLPDGSRMLLKPLRWADGVISIFVPVGFVTDFSSVPRILEPLMPRWDVLDRAGVVHDHLYARGYRRQLADAIWREIAGAEEGVSSFAAWRGWAALRVGGWIAYRRHAKRKGRPPAGTVYGE